MDASSTTRTKRAKLVLLSFGVCQEVLLINGLMEESESSNKVIDLASRCQSSTTEYVSETNLYG